MRIVFELIGFIFCLLICLPFIVGIVLFLTLDKIISEIGKALIKLENSPLRLPNNFF